MKVKIDLRFFSYPLWFQVSKSSEGHFFWQSQDQKYSYTSAYRTPDQLDFLFGLYLLMRTQEANDPAELTFSRYEILKGCGCPINPQYLNRLEDSLKRWSEVSFCFREGLKGDGPEQHFQFIQNYTFSPNTKKRLNVSFDPHLLEVLRKSAHFKYILFDYYKTLHRPVSRRLYEILTAAFKSDGTFKIPLVELGHLLTLYTRKKQNKNKEWVDVIYPSDVLTSVKSAINEMNKLATDAPLLRQMGMDPKEVYAVAYEVNKKKKTIEFTQVPLSHLFDELTQEQELNKEEESTQLKELYAYLKRSSKPTKELIKRYCQSHDYDYVKWNIFYANQHGLRNYASYLKLCLQHNWAQELREEYECLFGNPNQILDERKQQSLLKVAEKANYLVLSNGKRFKIKKVYPNGAIEVFNRTYKMNFVLSPAEAYGCRFES